MFSSRAILNRLSKIYLFCNFCSLFSPHYTIRLLTSALPEHPCIACLICYLIWRQVKYAAIVGVVGLLLKTVPIQTGLSKVSSVLRYN